MRLFHGSTCRVERPDVYHSRENLDFGKGFYLTSYQNQAQRWALRKASFSQEKAIVNIFDFRSDFSGVDFSEIKVLEFLENNEEWVEFVCQCRRGEKVYSDFDLIVGGVANDKVYEAVNMYFKGYWDMPTLIEQGTYGIQYLAPEYLAEEILKDIKPREDI